MIFTFYVTAFSIYCLYRIKQDHNIKGKVLWLEFNSLIVFADIVRQGVALCLEL